MENIIEICIGIDIAILGIAYPIIIDKTSNIGDKYSSNYLSNIFNFEFPQCKLRKFPLKASILKLTLFFTIFSFLFLIFKFKPLFGWNNWLINNSADIIVLLLTTILTIFFFIWLDKVLLYTGKSTSLLKHIIDIYFDTKINTENQTYCLKAINEITLYAIEKQDEHLQETLAEFYYQVFSSIRKEHKKGIPLEYPVDLYQLVSALNRNLAAKEEQRLGELEHRATSGLWLLGEDLEEIEISEATYANLWKNICYIYEKSKFVKMFWANSFQYFSWKLPVIYPIYSQKEKEIENHQEVNHREIERNRFLEFHYGLGGLLLYSKQYKSIKYILSYTQSIPPEYVLFPKDMTELFSWFEQFNNKFDHNSRIDIKYYFPDLDNLGISREARRWICKFIVLLFIRQFSLIQSYTYQNHTGIISLPTDIYRLESILNDLVEFNICLKQLMENFDLFKELEYIERIRENDYYNYLNSLKEKIKTEIGYKKVNLPISEEKLYQFNSKTNEIISNAFNEYNSIFIEHIASNKQDNKLKLELKGSQILFNKSAFIEGDIPHLNFDTIYASFLAREVINRYIPNSFYLAKTRRYLLNEKNIIDGIHRAASDINQNEIVVIGINMKFDVEKLLEQGFSHIIKLNSSLSSIRNAIFVMKKSNLPSIEFRELDKQLIEKQKLVLINKKINLYTSVLDLTQQENIQLKEEWSANGELKEGDIKVQLAIAFHAVVSWKKERDIILLNINSQYQEQGIEDEVTKIEPIK